jgi:serine/threonine-protein kinase
MTDIVDRLKTALADRYRIERELGSGGMATVYLAEDLKHRRQVAVKVLRPELAAVLGAHRFLNEINVTAQLQHPHILPLFDSGEADGLLYYVMPYVEGVSLEERLRREKQLSIEESLRITGAVASALSHAHRHGVLHRDIKPGNILLHEGDATVADFGIAVAVRAAAGDRLTETGLSLGTPQYMSPEQATGDRELDARSDVYSLGAVLYEMLAGDPPHTGPTVQAVISKVVTEHPRPVGELRDTVPVHIETALDKALAKLPADRFTTAEEFAVALERSGAEVVSAGRRTVVAGTAWAERAVRLGSLALTWAVLATAVAVWAMLRPPPAGPVTRWSVNLPPDDRLSTTVYERPIAISPDGARFAYTAESKGESRLFIRDLDNVAARPVAGTEGARSPFFSPDGEWIGFFSSNRLFRVSVAGGSPLEICEVPALQAGATWVPNDTVYFFSVDVGLFRVPATGGTREPLEVPHPPGATAYYMGWPIVLPSGAFMATAATRDGPRIATLPVGAREWRLLQELGEASPVQYLQDGHLIYSQAGALRAVPFDQRRLRAVGPSFTIVDSVSTARDGSAAYAAVAHTGTMLYVPERGAARTLVWVDREGRATPLEVEPAYFAWPRVSPDGRRLVVNITSAGLNELWVYDVARATRRQLPGPQTTDPIWTPDGESITYGLFGVDFGVTALARVSADGTGELDTLVPAERLQAAHSWSPDGERLAYYQINPATARDIFLLSRDGTPTSFLSTPANERSPVFSPDGRWIAYASDETGRDEVYLALSDDPQERHQISTGGGRAPVWSRDGRELYYRNRAAVMAVEIRTSPALRISAPQLLFEGPYEPDPAPSGSVNYDVAPDGRFLMVQSAPLTEIHVVLNWMEELR